MKSSLKQNFITSKNMNDVLFYNSLIQEFNEIIEKELSKSYEEINAEIIDDCCLALASIQSLQNGEIDEVTGVMDINAIINKYNLNQRKKYVISAACAAAAVFIIGMSTVNFDNEILAESNIFQTALGRLESLINRERISEPEITEPETTIISQEITTDIVIKSDSVTSNNIYSDESKKSIKNIYAIVSSDSNVVYNSVKDINLGNIPVVVNYTSGENETININECNVKIGEPLSDGETKITISYKGIETFIYVTVISEEKLNPVTLTSIYGIFENDYTIEDMRVFAVFSDGSEKEIDKTECKIEQEFLSDSSESIITVSYSDCSFQFLKGIEVTE